MNVFPYTVKKSVILALSSFTSVSPDIDEFVKINVAYRQRSSPWQLVGSSDRGTRARAKAPRASSSLWMMNMRIRYMGSTRRQTCRNGIDDLVGPFECSNELS